jgi:hypothetical protein
LAQTKYFDEDSGSYYWYSNRTGETRWDDELGDASRSHSHHESGEIDELEERRNPSAQDYSDDEDILDEEAPPIRPVEYVESDDEAEVDEETDELISSLIDRDVLYRTKQDITIFTYCFILHAIFVEAPLCVLEAILRCLFFFITGIFLLFLSLFALPFSIFCVSNPQNLQSSSTPLPPLLRAAILCLLESLHSFALGLSLSIPCCILLIYRDFNGVNEWKLHPIPSVIGWIDPRRLAMISLGQGATARNSSFAHSPFEQLPQIEDEMMDSIAPPVVFQFTFRPSVFSTPLCFPREVLLFLRSKR